MTARSGLVVQNLRSAVRGPFTASFGHGACAVVQGPSGAGKSLFLRMVADLDPNTGTVTLDDVDRATISAPRWRAQVTYVAAEPGFWAETLGEHMADRDAARHLLLQVGLDPALMEAPVARLSTGERQRAGLIRAVVGRPRFLLLDEPTSALDGSSRGMVEALLCRLRMEGLGLVVVSHDDAQVQRIADRRFRLSPAGMTEVS